MTISVIVMTLNAEKTLDALLCRLEQQTLPPCEILVADSESDDGTAKIAATHPLVTLLTIPRKTLLTNEDMLMAAAQLKRGKKIAYCAEAKVWHSHGYSLAQDYRRSFDIGVFLKQHQDDLPGRTANHEGLRYVRWVSVRLLKKARLCSLVRFFFHCAARYLGSRAGRRYERMSREM